MSRDVNYYRNFNNTDVDVNLGKKLNIAMFTNNYFPFVGGVPISIDRLAIGLRKRGNSVELFAPRYPEAVPNESNVHRCNLLYYAKTSKFNYAIANIFSRKISQEFNKVNFDIVHAHHPFWMGKRGLKLGMKSNIPVVLTYHTRLEMYFDNLPSFKMLFKNILSHRIIRRFAQKCDGIIAPTVSAMEYLENIGVSKQKIVLPTGIGNNCYNVKDAGELINGIRNSYAPNGQVLLCSVSRLAVEKNIDFLIRGLCAVKENTQTKFKCIIIGDGPERASIDKLIDDLSLRNEVTLIGKVNPEDIAEYYQASNLFVFSSLSETQGMVLLEAMAGNCPVVCVKSSGTDDVVENGFNGYKTLEDTEEWSKKIIYLLENRDVLEMMSSNAFSYSKDFSLDKMAERVEMFYKKLISAK